MTALVAPARMRSTMAEENGAIRVRIPARRNDYGAKTIRFGSGIDEAEARMILDSIRTRFPELGS